MYKINGYDLYAAFGIYPDQDRTTADSFEKPAEPVEVFSHNWGNGVVEYDLNATPQLKPRLFTIKGTLYVETFADYQATMLAVNTVLYENYVTLESTAVGVKVNAKLKGIPTWNRLTPLDGKIAILVAFQFDEVLQAAEFKDNGTLNITYYIGNNEKIFLTGTNKNYIK
jgi:hypothetical protein